MLTNRPNRPDSLKRLGMLCINTYFFSSDTKLLVITGEWEIEAGEIFWPNGESAFTEVIDFSEEKLVCDTFTTDYERHSYFGMTGGLITIWIAMTSKS